MDGPFESFDIFNERRDRSDDDFPQSPVRGDIDDMLESLDRAFRGDDDESAWREVALSHATALSTLRDALLQVLRQLERLDVLTAPQPLGRSLSEFIGATRVRAHGILKTIGPADDPAPVAGSIEIEIGFDDLHEFMLCPDIGCWSDGARYAG